MRFKNMSSTTLHHCIAYCIALTARLTQHPVSDVAVVDAVKGKHVNATCLERSISCHRLPCIHHLV